MRRSLLVGSAALLALTAAHARAAADAAQSDAGSHRTFLSPTALVAPDASVTGDMRGWPSPFVAGVGVAYVASPGLELGIAVGVDTVDFPSRSGIAGSARYQLSADDDRAIALYGALAAHKAASTDGNPAYAGRVTGTAGAVATWCFDTCLVLLNAHAGVIPNNGYYADTDWQVRVLGSAGAIIGTRAKLVLDATVTTDLLDDYVEHDDIDVVGYAGLRFARREVALDFGAFASTFDDGYHEILGGFALAAGISVRR